MVHDLSGEVLGEQIGLVRLSRGLELQGSCREVFFGEDANGHVELATLEPSAGSDGGLATGTEKAEETGEFDTLVDTPESRD